MTVLGVLFIVAGTLGGSVSCGANASAAKDWRPVSVAASHSLKFAYETLSARNKLDQERAARRAEGTEAKLAAVREVQARYEPLFKTYRAARAAWEAFEAVRAAGASEVDMASAFATLSVLQQELLRELEREE